VKTYYSLRCTQPAVSALRRALEPLFVVACVALFGGAIWMGHHPAATPGAKGDAAAVAVVR